MAARDARERGASLRVLMDEFTALYGEVSALVLQEDLPSLAEYRWRPGSIDAPAIYCLIGDAPLVQKDQVLWHDTIPLNMRVAVAYGDDASEMGLLESYIDCVRQVYDPRVLGRPDGTPRPLNGAAIWGARTSMSSVPEEFNGVPYATFEFRFSFRLDRFIEEAT